MNFSFLQGLLESQPDDIAGVIAGGVVVYSSAGVLTIGHDQ